MRQVLGREDAGRCGADVGIALTGPLALNAGTNEARSSSGTGNGMLTSNGASPWMRIRQPVGCKPQSGSTSMATKPYWVKRIRSTPRLRPWMTIRCAAAVPCFDLAGDDRQVLLGRSHAALGGPLVDREASDIRQHAQRAGTRRTDAFLRRSGSKSETGFPNRICSITM